MIYSGAGAALALISIACGIIGAAVHSWRWVILGFLVLAAGTALMRAGQRESG